MTKSKQSKIKRAKSQRPPTMSNTGLRALTTMSSPSSLINLFPDRLRTWSSTSNLVAQSATTGISLQYKISDPFNLFGPRTNLAGAFAANVPAGSSYLISSNATAGAAAPYRYCIVERVEVEVDIASAASNTVGTEILLVFSSIVDTGSGMSFQSTAEQPFSKRLMVPPNPTGRQSLKACLNLNDFWGVPSQIYSGSPYIYGSAPGAPPGLIVYCTILTRALDGATAGSYSLLMNFKSQNLFCVRNNFTSTVPT